MLVLLKMSILSFFLKKKVLGYGRSGTVLYIIRVSYTSVEL
jgi:hypothetical protein